MGTQQLILSLLLATMVFSVALEVKPSDFARVLQTPRSVLCGLIPQFILLSVATCVATLLLALPPSVEVANNPNTASWLKVLAIEPTDIWFSLILLLALPMSLGLAAAAAAN